VPAIPSCTLIDTDFDLDDLMAIPLVVGSRLVAAILVTEGVVKADVGAAALVRLIADTPQRALPVMVGVSTELPDAQIERQWGYFLPDSRRMMHRGLGLGLPQTVPQRPAAAFNLQQLQQVLSGCQQVDVLLLGPYSSFVQYSPLIRSRIGQVVIMGKPLLGDGAAAPAKLPFNCSYDLAACELATKTQLPGLRHAFVDVPRTAMDGNARGLDAQVYGPTLAMVQGLASTGLAGRLRQALLGTVPSGSLGEDVPGPDYWAIDCCLRRSGKSLLWDPMAALYLVRPELFSQVGGPEPHFETQLSPGQIRQVWTETSNRAASDRP
jgi:inosine-uridine nucleoside N-ribohydrolase